MPTMRYGCKYLAEIKLDKYRNRERKKNPKHALSLPPEVWQVDYGVLGAKFEAEVSCEARKGTRKETSEAIQQSASCVCWWNRAREEKIAHRHTHSTLCGTVVLSRAHPHSTSNLPVIPLRSVGLDPGHQQSGFKRMRETLALSVVQLNLTLYVTLAAVPLAANYIVLFCVC